MVLTIMASNISVIVFIPNKVSDIVLALSGCPIHISVPMSGFMHSHS